MKSNIQFILYQLLGDDFLPAGTGNSRLELANTWIKEMNEEAGKIVIEAKVMLISYDKGMTIHTLSEIEPHDILEIENGGFCYGVELRPTSVAPALLMLKYASSDRFDEMMKGFK